MTAHRLAKLAKTVRRTASELQSLLDSFEKAVGESGRTEAVETLDLIRLRLEQDLDALKILAAEIESPPKEGDNEQ